MKRVLIASLFSLAAAPVFATTPSFNDFPEQGQLEASRVAVVVAAPSFNDFPEHGQLQAGIAGRAAVEIAPTVAVSIPPSFNDQPDLEAAKASGNVGLAGRGATDIVESGNVLWTPAY